MEMNKKRLADTIKLGPWSNVAAARSFFYHLAASESVEYGMDWSAYAADFDNVSQLGAWLIAEGVGPLAYNRFQRAWPELASHLQIDAFAAAAENSIHFERLQRVSQTFEKSGVQFALLKGAALAHYVYPDPSMRTMSDIDIWLPHENMETAFHLMEGIGFKAYGSEKRPPKLQLLSQGEIQFYDSQNGLVELHWAPMSGWFLRTAANIDNDAIWSRTQTLVNSAGRVLAAEDTIIQVALHTAVNHRFRLAAIRSMVDLTLTAKTQSVEWSIVAERAKKWRVATAVWCVLNLAQSLIGLPEASAAMETLEPSLVRRALLRRFVSSDAILSGDNKLGEAMENNLTGYLFLLLLVDRPIDAVKLFGRVIWPSREWLDARYKAPTNRWQHFLRLLRRGKI